MAILFTLAACSSGAYDAESEDGSELFEEIPNEETSSALEAEGVKSMPSDSEENSSADLTDEELQGYIETEIENEIANENSGRYDSAEDEDSEVDSDEDENAIEGKAPIKIIPIDIKKIEVNEAIVIDDTSEDLLEASSGTEVDFESVSCDEDLPVFYSSDQVDNKDYITPVRNQGFTALCWNYAALGAVESDLLIHHEELSPDSLNLSEKHGAYYNMHKATGSVLGGIDDDYREFEFLEDDGFLSDYDTSYLSVGGVTDYCLSILTSWKGPVVDEDNNSIHVLKGQNDIYTQNSDKPSGAYDNAFCHVQNVLEVLATEKNRNIIKSLIMKHGSVTASINSDDSFWTGKKVALYDYKPYGEENYADHEILIVGWNDEYPAENFITRPETDGAFICKNSWGEKYGASGYFYLSYEDSILCNNIVAAYDCAMPGDNNWYDKNYQYAAFLTHIKDPIVDQRNVVYMYDKNNASYGMLFSPEEDEVLSAIGYFSMNTLNNDKVSVYKLGGSESDEAGEYYNLPDSDESIITMDCKSVTGGYHTFPLKKSIALEKGKRYLITITPGKKQRLVYEKALDYTTHPHKDEWQHNLGAIHTHNTASGHCYLQDSTGDLMIRQDDKDFFIKVYTRNKKADAETE
ncbi:C1 family peptidase [Butyrivibrio sp. VCD2006]|uniref:C1 family peptidase n=1 Tax=Butyrivibrio sp. VCD2006 TaxID=1280664 RepID=UPI000414D477|nr:C1 family peptidase [Butyrivibrio sp. VCD2006]